MGIIYGTPRNKSERSFGDGINYNDERINALIKQVNALTKQVNALVKIANRG